MKVYEKPEHVPASAWERSDPILDPSVPGSDQAVVYGRCVCGEKLIVPYAPTMNCPACSRPIVVVEDAS
jgi:hypothetical protein